MLFEVKVLVVFWWRLSAAQYQTGWSILFMIITMFCSVKHGFWLNARAHSFLAEIYLGHAQNALNRNRYEVLVVYSGVQRGSIAVRRLGRDHQADFRRCQGDAASTETQILLITPPMRGECSPWLMLWRYSNLIWDWPIRLWIDCWRRQTPRSAHLYRQNAHLRYSSSIILKLVSSLFPCFSSTHFFSLNCLSQTNIKNPILAIAYEA